MSSNIQYGFAFPQLSQKCLIRVFMLESEGKTQPSLAIVKMLLHSLLIHTVLLTPPCHDLISPYNVFVEETEMCVL